MAAPCWTVMVLVFLCARNGLASVDQSWLTSIVEGIKKEYALGNNFSVAVNIPQNQDPNDLNQVLQDDPPDKVKEDVSNGQVYQGSRVVAAAQSDAASRVLDNIQPFIKSSSGNVLVIYSEDSPNENGIAGKTDGVTQNWSEYAFVFSKVADSPDTDLSQLAESFKQLEIAKLGLDNIFRCYSPGDDSFQCTSCSSGGDVAPSCVTNAAVSDQEQGAAETGGGTGIDTGVGKEITKGTGEVAQRKGKGKAGRIGRCKGHKKKGCKRRESGKLGKARKGKKQGRGRKGKKQGPGRKGKKQGPGRKGKKQGPGREGKKQGPGRKGKKQGPGRKGKKQGPGRKDKKGGKRWG